MDYTYNDNERKILRQNLRRNSTQPERVLWYHLRGRRVQGLKFRRQYGVGPYVLDFYCPELRLGVEVDGDSHYTASGELHDAQRAEFLKLRHITLLRFTNLDINTNIEGVLTVIASHHP